MRAPIAPLALLLISLAAACGSKSPTKDPGGPIACADTADAFAKAEQRCGNDYQTSYDALVDSFGGCDKVQHIRDETTLRSVCIPSFAKIGCPDLARADVDETCKTQLITASIGVPIVPAGVFGAMTGNVDE